MMKKNTTNARVLQLFREHCYITDKFILKKKAAAAAVTTTKKQNKRNIHLKTSFRFIALPVLISYTAELLYVALAVFMLFFFTSFSNVIHLNLSSIQYIIYIFFNCVKSKKRKKIVIPFLFSSILLLEKCVGARTQRTKKQQQQNHELN